MKKNYLNSEAVIQSLRLAFDSPPNIALSIQRFRGMISRLPSGSLFIVHSRNHVCFYEFFDQNESYLRKDSNKLYLLARKRYLQQLLHTLNTREKYGYDSDEWCWQFDKLASLIRDYAKGNLDIARIVLNQKQYKWFTGQYKKKKLVPEDDSKLLTIPYNDFESPQGTGTTVRSKSEQNIGNVLWDFAAPAHYEEQLVINVQKLINELSADLERDGFLNRNLFYYHEGSCFWNVPSEYDGMNAPGSLWHTYNHRTGCVHFHPDFTIMLADGSLVYWEHEGLFTKYPYRANASERICIMRFPGGIPTQNIIETTELESNDRIAVEEIIRTRILPRVWF